MIKKFALVIFLTLFSQAAVARDYKTVFHAKITTDVATADSACNNKENEAIPISKDLTGKGWICVLAPRTLDKGEYQQAIICKNTNGAMVATVAHCTINQQDADVGSFILDDMNESFKGTKFVISCSTVVGDRI